MKSRRIDLFRVSGLYSGFVHDGAIYDPDGRYLGWVEADGSAWGADGRYAGELDRAGYVLRDLAREAPPPRVPPRTPAPDVAVQFRTAHRGSYAPRAGLVDAVPSLLTEADESLG